MARLTLLNMNIENFKGIKKLQVQMDGENTEIAAENGVGKTTVYDAFLWLLFGKDSTGRSDFGVRPLDSRNNPIKGLVTMVEALVKLDGEMHVFRKELHENIVKKQLRGYTSVCSVNGVPKLVKEYQACVEAIVSEEKFKLLTDVAYFCDKLHWVERRKVLLDLAGEYEKPEGYDKLLTNAGNLSLDDYKKKITDEKKTYAKEREGINPRIDEILKGLEQPEGDLGDVAKKRDAGKEQLGRLKDTRAELLAGEQARQKKINRKNLLTVEQKQREINLKNDPARTKAFQDEKAKITARLADMGNALIKNVTGLRLEVAETNSIRADIGIMLGNLENARKKLNKAKDADVKDVCYACSQKLPEDMLKKVADERDKEMGQLEAVCKKCKDIITPFTERLEVKNKLVIDLNNLVNKGRAEVEAERITANKRIEEINAAIYELPPVDFNQDDMWNELGAEIKRLETEIGEPASESLARLDGQVEAVEDDINKLNGILVKADRLESDRQRVAMLELREKDLAQLIADIDEMLHAIQEYKRDESNKITDAVNGMFKAVTFKMFEIQMNGEIDDRMCEAVYQGVPYADMSFGQRIYCGIDIINTLSEYYGLCVPLFIDHAESMTLPIECKAQTVMLRAKDGVRQLQINQIAKAAQKVA